MTQLSRILKRIAEAFGSTRKTKETKEVTFRMSDSFISLLDELQEKTGRSDHAEVIRDAVTVHSIVVDEYKRGNNLFAGILLKKKKRHGLVLVYKRKEEGDK